MDPGPRQVLDLAPRTLLANLHNEAVQTSAERVMYFHPDDHPFAGNSSLPRPVWPRVQVSGGPDFANKDRPLSDILEQIDKHDPNSGSVIADYTWPIPGYQPPAE